MVEEKNERLACIIYPILRTLELLEDTMTTPGTQLRSLLPRGLFCAGVDTLGRPDHPLGNALHGRNWRKVPEPGNRDGTRSNFGDTCFCSRSTALERVTNARSNAATRHSYQSQWSPTNPFVDMIRTRCGATRNTTVSHVRINASLCLLSSGSQVAQLHWLQANQAIRDLHLEDDYTWKEALRVKHNRKRRHLHGTAVRDA